MSENFYEKVRKLSSIVSSIDIRVKRCKTTSITLPLKIVNPLDQKIIQHLELIYGENGPREQVYFLSNAVSVEITKFLRSTFADSELEISIIAGQQPGIGKTLSVAATFFRLVNVNSQDEFLWIPVNRIFGGYYKFRGGELVEICKEPIRYTAKTILVVYDGIDKENFQEWNKTIQSCSKALREERPCIVILTSFQDSLQANMKNTFKKADFKVRELVVRSTWTLDDYYEAVKCDIFFNQVKDKFAIPAEPFWEDNEANRKALIDDKFPYAGTCARWMFDSTIEEIIDFIEDEVQRLSRPDPAQLFGVRSNTNVNSLFQQIKGARIVPVSQYVVKHIAKFDSFLFKKFLQESWKLWYDFDPALDGWIVELGFHVAIKNNQITSRLLTTFDGIHQEKNFDVRGIAKFHSTKMFDLKFEDIKDGCWYIPEIVNQGGFDFVQQIEEKLRFFQVTRANTHSLKCSYLFEFLKGFNDLRIKNGLQPIVKFEVIFVVPANFKELAMEEPEEWPSARPQYVYGGVAYPIGDNPDRFIGKFTRTG